MITAAMATMATVEAARIMCSFPITASTRADDGKKRDLSSDPLGIPLATRSRVRTGLAAFDQSPC